MIARLLISTSLETRVGEVEKILVSLQISKNHPDLLYLEDEKLGVEQAKIIRNFLSTKPHSKKGKVVVVENAGNLTVDGQNALLKTLEEPPKDALLILGADSEDKFLPTVISRCEITYIPEVSTQHTPGGGLPAGRQGYVDTVQDIEKLINSPIDERFEYIEKLKDKEQFLLALIHYFRNRLLQMSSDRRTNEFLKELLQAEQWAKQNVNIRAILEYLMLIMPKA